MTNKEVYQRCLELVNSDQVIVWPHMNGLKYICKNLGVCDLLLFIRSEKSRCTDFVEWFKQNPNPGDDPYEYWWPIEDRQSRRLALLEAIKLCDDADNI